MGCNLENYWVRYLKETCAAAVFVTVTFLPYQALADDHEAIFGDYEIYIPETPPPVVQPPPPPPPVVVTPPPPPVVVPPPPPVVVTPPPVLPPPVVHIPFIQPQSIDVTNAAASVKPNLPQPIPLLTGNAADGMQTIAEDKFPDLKDAKGGGDWILVRGEHNAVYKRPNEYTAKLENGTILVSVRRPSQFALIQTPAGDVALHSDGDLMLTWEGDVLRIFNISAMGSDCKIKFGEGVVHDSKSQTVQLKPGYEVVASSRVLTRADLRPSDGIARRRAQLVANGHIGISEFMVQNLLANSAIIAQLVQEQSNVKETRVLAQMSKMAAVLNHVNSPYGYTIEGKTGLASGPQPR